MRNKSLSDDRSNWLDIRMSWIQSLVGITNFSFPLFLYNIEHLGIPPKMSSSGFQGQTICVRSLITPKYQSICEYVKS